MKVSRSKIKRLLNSKKHGSKKHGSKKNAGRSRKRAKSLGHRDNTNQKENEPQLSDDNYMQGNGNAKDANVTINANDAINANANDAITEGGGGDNADRLAVNGDFVDFVADGVFAG